MSLLFLIHCSTHLLRRCPLVAVIAYAAPAAAAAAAGGDDGAATCDCAVLCSVCLNVNSMPRSDVCDNQDPAKCYNLQSKASAS